MRQLLLLWIAIAFTYFLPITQAEAGRIRLRKVKDPPKVCSVMSEDKLLSRNNKRIFGTLRNSVIIEDNVSIVNDLGKKICQWPVEKWQSLGDLSKYSYYINEQKNALYPYMKADRNQYQFVKISLEDCEFGEIQTADNLELPKCEKSKKKSRFKSKRRLASSSKARS